MTKRRKTLRRPSFGLEPRTLDIVEQMLEHRFQWACARPKSETHAPWIWRPPLKPDRGLDGIEHLWPRPAIIPSPIWEPDILQIERVIRPAYRHQPKVGVWTPLWQEVKQTCETGDAVRVVFKTPIERARAVGAMSNYARKELMALRSMREGSLSRIMWVEKRVPSRTIEAKLEGDK